MATENIPKYRSLYRGMMQRIDESLAYSNACYLSNNFRFNKVIGRACLRDGSKLIGEQIIDNKPCLGLHNFISSTATKNALLAVFSDGTNNDIYKLGENGWVKSLEDDTKDLKTRFCTFLNSVVRVNGTDNAKSFDGSEWITTGGVFDVANMPKGKYVVEWKDKVYTAGVSGSPDTLYYSSTPKAGAVSWTEGNGFINIEPEDGGGTITALAKSPGYLLIFKERSLKRWDGASTYPESLNNIGTPSQESVILGRDTILYFNPLGIYETNGVKSVKLSRPIQDIIEAIPSTNYANITGYSDGDMCRWSIGSGIKVDGITFNNVEIVYSLDDKNWTMYSYPTNHLFYSTYIDGTSIKKVCGDNDGNILELDTDDTDNNQNINYIYQTLSFEFGDRGRIKNIPLLEVYSKNMQGATVSCRIDGKNNFKPIGVIKDDFQEIKCDLIGKTFEFRIIGTSKGGNSDFIGIDFPKGSVTESYNK